MEIKVKNRVIGTFSFRPPGTGRAGDSHSYPLFRSWILTLVTAVFLGSFSVPLFTVGSTLDWGRVDDLFSLVSLLFNAFWLLGWSVGVLLLAAIFLGSTLGVERVIYTPGRLIVRVEVLGIGLSRFFDSDKIEEIAWLETAGEKTGLAWRGSHMTFRYLDEPVSFGTHVDKVESGLIIEKLKRVVLSQSPPRSAPVDPVPENPQSANQRFTGAEAPEQLSLGSMSSIALILANCLPVLGVIFLDWRVGEVMLLYWAESAVVGIYNVAKMWVVGRWSVLFMGPFFIGHYGGFMAGHLLFIYGFMFTGEDKGTSLAEVMLDFVTLAPALLVFFVSHGISFYQNFLGRREYLGRQISKQMSEPYRRIIIMHVTIIFGGFLAAFLDSPLPALILMIVLKVGADLFGHLRERKTS